MSKKVEDLVKVALKEALEKRRKAAPLEEPVVEAFPHDEMEAFIETSSPSVGGRMPLPPDEKYVSEVLGIDPDKVTDDFPVSVFFGYPWDSRIAGFVPEINKEYVFDLRQAKSVLLAWQLNENILCYGPTGAGKSSLIEQLCARTNRPFIRINCTGDMDSSMIFGQLVAKEGTTHWVDGAVTEAVRYGAVFAWDEWDVTPPEISMGLQWLLEDSGKLFLKDMPGASVDKLIVPHENFRIVAIGNTQGQGDDNGAHAGTNVQNSATLDRFGTAIYVDYLEPHLEERMLMNRWSSAITAKSAKQLVKLANLIRQGYKAGQLNLTVSPRSLFSICRKLSVPNGHTMKTAFEVVYLNKLNDTQRKVAEQFYEKTFGTAT